MAELHTLESVNIPRFFRPPDLLFELSTFELHMFVDASTAAFGAVAYLRNTAGNKACTHFIVAKSHLVPIQTLRNPRLELQAAVLAVRLAKKIQEELPRKFPLLKYLKYISLNNFLKCLIYFSSEIQ